MKVHVIETKNGIWTNVDVSVKNQMTEVLVNTCDSKTKRTCEFGKYLDIKNCSQEISLFGKLVLPFEDEILNITETSLPDKKVTHKKKQQPYLHYFINNYVLVIIITLVCQINRGS